MSGIIMKNVYWTNFGSANKYDSFQSFVKDVTEYNNEIAAKDNGWRPEEMVIDKPTVIIEVEAGWKEEDDTLIITVKGKNGKNIEMGELLFAVHNLSVDYFQEGDAFFEGFTKAKDTDGVPTYHMNIGT